MKWNPIKGMGDCPKIPGEYLVTSDPNGLHARYVHGDCWNGHDWHFGTNVIAWTEFPEPYEPPEVVELDIESVTHKSREEL